MKRTDPGQTWNRIGPLVSMVLVVGVLYFAQDLLLPFALAALVTFLLAPIVAGLQHWHFPRVVAVVTSVLLALGLVVALLVTLISQVNELSESLPKYRDTISEKLSAVGGTVAGITKGLEEAMPEATEAAKPPPPAAGANGPMLDEPNARKPTSGIFPFAAPKTAPIEVTVVPNKPGPFELVGSLAGPVLGPLGNIAVVFVLVLFMLMYMEDLRDRMVSVISRHGVTVTTQAMTDVTTRISRYLLMTLIVNTTYGIPVGIGLLLLGVPNALLWGLLAIVLRFIPYLGPWMAALFPIALSFAISPGWELTIAVTGMFLVIELISNNIVEPLLYGSRTGLSPVAIIVSAIFWTWLWGTAGLLLAVPLTLIVVVSGRYVPSLRFLYTLFGDDPGLGPEARFYQRLVAGNSDEAERVLSEFLEKRPLPDLYDSVVLPALRSAKHDEAAGRLTAEAAASIREMVGEIAVGLPALSEKKKSARARLAKAEVKQAEKNSEQPTGIARIDANGGTGGSGPNGGTSGMNGDGGTATSDKKGEPKEPPPASDVRVVYLPTGDDSGALVGPLLADLLKADGIELKVLPVATLSSELVQEIADAEPDIVIIAGMPPVPLVRMRYLIAKASTIPSHALIRAGVEKPEVRIIAGLWNANVDDVHVGTAIPPRRRVGFGHKSRRPTLLSEVRPRPDAESVDEEATATFLEAGAAHVTHTLVDTVEAVKRAVQHVNMRLAGERAA